MTVTYTRFFLKEYLKKERNQSMKARKTNKVAKIEVKKVKNKGAVSKNVVRVAISPRSPQGGLTCSVFRCDQWKRHKHIKYESCWSVSKIFF